MISVDVFTDQGYPLSKLLPKEKRKKKGRKTRKTKKRKERREKNGEEGEQRSHIAYLALPDKDKTTQDSKLVSFIRMSTTHGNSYQNPLYRIETRQEVGR